MHSATSFPSCRFDASGWLDGSTLFISKYNSSYLRCEYNHQKALVQALCQSQHTQKNAWNAYLDELAGRQASKQEACQLKKNSFVELDALLALILLV